MLDGVLADRHAFAFEQFDFPVEFRLAAGAVKTLECSAAGHHSVAGDQRRVRVGAQRLADSPVGCSVQGVG